MKKSVILYGVLMALVIALLKGFEYRYTIKSLGTEVYIGIIALVFTGLGIWLGRQFIQNRSSTVTEGSDLATIKKELDLSDRELDVLKLIAEGLSNQEIADQLFISIHTVKTHTSNLFFKLRVKRRTQAIQRSRELGLIAS